MKTGNNYSGARFLFSQATTAERDPEPPYPPESWKFRCPSRQAAAHLYGLYLRDGYNATRDGTTVILHPTAAETIERRRAERNR